MAAYAPSPPSLCAALAEALAGCRRCALGEGGGAVAVGEGSAGSAVMVVGARAARGTVADARPLAGPAARLLERALAEVGLDRSEVYVTTVLKHPPSETGRPRASLAHVAACLPWLEAEIDAVRPAVVVCLGAAPARALLGDASDVALPRGALLPCARAPAALVTVSPATVLRTRAGAARRAAYARFVADLGRVAEHVRALRGEPRPAPPERAPRRSPDSDGS